MRPALPPALPRFPRAVLALALGSAFLAPTARAEPYRLVIGDRVTVNYDFLEAPKTAVIDLDGNIRLSELGSIGAAGRSLDEIEDFIAEEMVTAGFSGVSFVSVEVAEYAPVIVSGFVEQAGRVEYLPGMTVGAAVALAGGPRRGATGGDPDLQAINARRRAEIAGTRIAEETARIARLEAALAGDAAPIDPGAVPREGVPAEWRDMLDAQLALQAGMLAAERQAQAALAASVAQEVADYEEQARLIDDRIGVKREVIASVTEELEAMDGLRSQGLTTTARLSSLTQRLADDREELLGLENAKVAARRSGAAAARGLDQARRAREAERMEALRTARLALDDAARAWRAALSEVALLDGGAILPPGGTGEPDLAYALLGPRADRVGDAVGPDTPLLPGDVLQVTARLAPPPTDG